MDGPNWWVASVGGPIGGIAERLTRLAFPSAPVTTCTHYHSAIKDISECPGFVPAAALASSVCEMLKRVLRRTAMYVSTYMYRSPTHYRENPNPASRAICAHPLVVFQFFGAATIYTNDRVDSRKEDDA